MKTEQHKQINRQDEKVLPEFYNKISHRIIGAAINIHKELGRALDKSIYEECLEFELRDSGYIINRQKEFPVTYKKRTLETGFKIDMLIENKIIVFIETKDEISNIDKSRLFSYLKLADKKLGLIINFNSKILKDGIFRAVV